MKKGILLTCMMGVALLMSSTTFAQKDKKQSTPAPVVTPTVAVVVPPAPTFTNRMDTISYILGADIAKSFIKNEMKVNQERMFKGFSDGMTKKDTVFTEAQITEIMKSYQEEMMKVIQAKKDIQQAKDDSVAKITIGLSKAFLAQNKTKPGIIELPSGIQYKMMKEGTGAYPKETDKVTVHYKGTLIDGTVFDSSIDRGEPVTFPLNQVIKGWTEGVQKCKLGGKIQLFIPSDLAYGDKTNGPIPGGSALIFEVELLKIEAASPEAAPADDAKAAPAKKAPAKTAAKPAATTAKPAAKPVAAKAVAKPVVKK